MNIKLRSIFKWCLFAMFLAIGWLLPLLTGQIKELGNALLPMHIPVFLCGFILGPYFGIGLGFLLPISRGLIFSQPLIYPYGICMAFELATYGFMSGVLKNLFFKIKKMPKIASIYICLIISQLLGRVIWALSRLIVFQISSNEFSWSILISSGFVSALPGIILQWLIIPPLVILFYKRKK